MVEWKVPLYKAYWDDCELQKTAEIIKSGMNWATGPCISEFEDKVAKYSDVEFAVAFNSGTSALHAMMLAAQIKEGDEVIVPSFTFIATVNSVLFVGAKPVFADIEESNYGLNPEDVREKITPRTRAILPIHYSGLPCKIDSLREIANDFKILLLEDAAESIGAEVNGRRVGSFGDQAMVSFCGNKVITTGEGGMVLTNEKRIRDKLKHLRSHGRNETEDYFLSSKSVHYVELGYNWRISNILASLGVCQMSKIDKIIDMRQERAQYYNQLLDKYEFISTPSTPPKHRHVFQMYTILLNDGRNLRDELAKTFSMNGIGTKVYFPPVHLTHFYQKIGYKKINLPMTEEISQRVLTLPLYPSLSKKEIEYICSIIESFKEKFID